MSEAFTAGVVRGGLTEVSQIKILICYVIANVQQPLSHSGLLEALSGMGYANYFDCAGAISELLDSDNIKLNSNGHYTLTASGRNIAELLSSDVALTVRERVLVYADVIARRESNSQSCTAEIERLAKGWRMRGVVKDNEGEIFAIEATFSELGMAQRAKNCFLDNVEKLVLENFSLLTDSETAGK